MAGFVGTELPVLAAILMTLSAVLSLITVIAIYREGGILKRLRATPLRPWMILTAHVLVKLTFTAITVILMIAAGKRYYPVDLQIPVVSFGAALILGTLGILSIGFLIASLVPTARFAQPVGTLILYPMIGLSGLFVPVSSLPAALRPIARMLPLTYAVSLLSGVLKGESWRAHMRATCSRSPPHSQSSRPCPRGSFGGANDARDVLSESPPLEQCAPGLIEIITSGLRPVTVTACGARGARAAGRRRAAAADPSPSRRSLHRQSRRGTRPLPRACARRADRAAGSASRRRSAAHASWDVFPARAPRSSSR